METSRTCVIVLVVSVVTAIVFVIFVGVVWFLIAVRSASAAAARGWSRPFIIVVIIATITATTAAAASILVFRLLLFGFLFCIIFLFFDHARHILRIFRLWRALWHRRFAFRVVRCRVFIWSVRSIDERVEQRLRFFLRNNRLAVVE